jgi:rhamnulokinase
MQSAANFLAVDLGASSGRVVAGRWNGCQIQLEELHRFPNAGVLVSGRLHWDVLNIWAQILAGFRRFSARYSECPASIGVDAWGIDFGLLDKRGRLIANPVHYRDRRTEGIPERLFGILDETSIFCVTGVQPWHINTLFQLYSMVLEGDPQLDIAHALLTIPDLFSHFLSGATAVEFTEATTTQMFAPRRGDWANDLIRCARIPEQIMPAVVKPCSRLGTALPDVLEESRFSCSVPVIAVAAHDTASAVAAIPSMDAQSAFISSGTWSLMGTEISTPNISEDAFCFGFTNEGSADGKFLLLKNLAGLWIIQECLRRWNMEGGSHDWKEVIEAATTAPAFRSLLDPNDKVFEMPVDMPATVQKYCGQRGQPVPGTVGEFARAVFEGLALSYRKVLRPLERLSDRTISVIRIVGGGSQNALLSQMVADACNRIVVTGPKEATVLGNVLAQAIATGHMSDFQQGRIAIAESFPCETYEPHPTSQWDEAFARFLQLGARHEAHLATSRPLEFQNLLEARAIESIK